MEGFELSTKQDDGHASERSGDVLDGCAGYRRMRCAGLTAGLQCAEHPEYGADEDQYGSFPDVAAAGGGECVAVVTGEFRKKEDAGESEDDACQGEEGIRTAVLAVHQQE